MSSEKKLTAAPGLSDKRTRLRSGISSVGELLAMPWSETALSVVLGGVLVLLGLRELGGLTWIIGLALGFSRYAYERKLEEETEPVHRLASVVDLLRQVTLAQFQEMIRVYLVINEPEFQQVKETIVGEAVERLTKLAQQKTSEQLATSEYYNWLLPIIESARPGSSMWAVSMMLTVEWDDSPAEENFLRLNLDAADRGVFVERIIVSPKDTVPKLASIGPIKAMLDKAGKYLTLRVVERELLNRHDPRLLGELGDGLIAFDKRVALIDANTPEGIRGHVTMNPAEVGRLHRMFTKLRVHSRPLTPAGMEGTEGPAHVAAKEGRSVSQT